MTHKFCHPWRRVFQLSATFLLAISLSVSCKKKDTSIGANAIDQNSLLNGAKVDTFSLKSFSIIEDSVRTKNPAQNTLGSYVDPVFGKVDASIYTQIRLASSNPNFGNTSQIVLDSFVLAMRYSGFTGKNDPQTFEVYELEEEISSVTTDAYYQFSQLNDKGVNMVVPGTGTITPHPEDDVFLDTVKTDPQMRLSLDTNVARTLIEEAASGGANFTSNTEFIKYFKGLYIKSNNPSQANGEGGVFYFNLNDADSKLTIYYRQIELINGIDSLIKKKYDFVINGNCEDFNRMTFDRSGTKVEQVINDTVSGQVEFYAQAMGARAAFKIPHLKNLPKTAVVHKAELFLPVQFQTGSVYSPGSTVTIATKETDESTELFLFNVGQYSEFRKGFVIDIRSHVQEVLAGRRENTDLIISPLQFVTTGQRIIFNGSETLNKVKPSLSIVFTEF